MNENGKLRWKSTGARASQRVYSLRKIAISYEGQDENIIIKPPNVSTRGMFINTSRTFPEGAVLNVCFELALSNAEIQTRCEVRYCQPGIGVGVEFIGLSAEARELIEQEIESNTGKLKRQRLGKKGVQQGTTRRRRKRQA